VELALNQLCMLIQLQNFRLCFFDRALHVIDLPYVLFELASIASLLRFCWEYAAERGVLSTSIVPQTYEPRGSGRTNFTTRHRMPSVSTRGLYSLAPVIHLVYSIGVEAIRWFHLTRFPRLSNLAPTDGTLGALQG